jgi:hypothetical protein
MNTEKRRKYYINIIAIITIILILPIVVFIFIFKNQIISTEISDWAAFGSYIGGVLNTIISLLSLIILGYITYLISKQSLLENKKLKILERKLNAYNELTKFYPKISHLLTNAVRILKLLPKDVKHINSLTDKDYVNKKDKIIEQLDILLEFHFYLSSFRIRYSHIFEYNFDCEDYQLLLESTNSYKTFCLSLMNKLELHERKYTEEPDSIIFDKRLVAFINTIKVELS